MSTESMTWQLENSHLDEDAPCLRQKRSDRAASDTGCKALLPLLEEIQ